MGSFCPSPEPLPRQPHLGLDSARTENVKCGLAGTGLHGQMPRNGALAFLTSLDLDKDQNSMTSFKGPLWT